MKIDHLLYAAAFVSFIFFISLMGSGCAQIGSPTGGPRDSTAPLLVSSTPKLLTTNFTASKITLVFNEYIDVQDVQNNVLVSPFPKINPMVDFKLKTVTIKLKDTLLPNTTYAINFGNAIRDNNEGNPFTNFTYVFSTGNTIDSLQLRGQVIIAETGKKDSTIIALLYRNLEDSMVQKRKPDYIAKSDSSGNFRFTNLSAGRYKLYALKDGDGGKTYNSKVEMFAFADSAVLVTDSSSAVTLYAYTEEKDIKKGGTPASGIARPTSQAEKKLRYTTNLIGNEQDLLSGFIISVNKPLKTLDPQKIILTDTNYNKLAATVTLDSTQKNISIQTKWQEDTHYRIIVSKDAISDSTGLQLIKSDTIRFISKKENAYGSLVIRFSNLAAANHPVLQFVRGEEIYKSVPITTTQWSDKLFVPGEYELRILFDANNNGVWDPGNYTKKLQPEKAITLDNNLNIKANWDNERDIRL
ncbi:MAG: Ig-like domain-containing protein [Ferruginibacter sp.]|nr:Ig-like domain-containing protein [Ferruginibacter sp.]